MKILLIAHFLPWPPHGGSSQRNFNLLRELNKECDIYMIGFTQRPHYGSEDEKLEAIAQLKKHCSYLQAFDIPTDYNRIGWYALLLGNILSREPYSVWRFRSRAFDRELDRLLREETFDIVYADTVATAPYALRARGRARLVLNHHNVESTLLLRRADNESNPGSRMYLRHQGRKLRRWEAKMCPQFDVNLTVSSLDADELGRQAPDAHYEVIANGTDTEYFAPRGESDGHDMMYAGGGTWYPNRDAMTWFCREIFPLIADKVPDATMNVIGGQPPAEVVAASGADARIKVHGFVPDVRPFMARSSVYVAPIRVGGGTRLKILDAFAAGKAVVSTAVGCEGIDCIDGEHIVIANTPGDIANRVVYLMQHPEKRREIERNARRLAENSYSWHIIGEKLRNLYREITR